MSHKLIQRWVTVFALAGTAAFCAFVLKTKAPYTAKTTLLMAAAPGTSLDALSAQFNKLKDSLLSDDTLTGVVRGLDLYSGARTAESVHDALNQMRDNDLQISPAQSERGNIAFSVAYRGENREKAVRAVEWLVNAAMTDANGRRSLGGAHLEILDTPDWRHLAFLSTWPAPGSGT